jgi:hypothetical protein
MAHSVIESFWVGSGRLDLWGRQGQESACKGRLVIPRAKNCAYTFAYVLAYS